VRLAAITVLAACSAAPSARAPVELSSTFTVDPMPMGSVASSLDPIAGQQISIDVLFPDLGFAQDDRSGCLTQTVFVDDAQPTASGPVADLVQTMILDRLPAWDVDVQVCSDGTSQLLVNADIDELNFKVGCGDVPAGAVSSRDPQGYPFVSTMTAGGCTADILDVVVGRDFTIANFSVTVATQQSRLP